MSETTPPNPDPQPKSSHDVDWKKVGEDFARLGAAALHLGAAGLNKAADYVDSKVKPKSS